MPAPAHTPVPLQQRGARPAPRLAPRPVAVASATPVVPDPVAERLTELAAFCLRTGRRPAFGVSDPQETSLAEWVHRMRKRRAFRPFIDDVVHPYPIRNPEKLEQLRNYCAIHGHRPAKRSADPVEAALARWVSEAKYLVDPDPELIALVGQYPPRPTMEGKTA